MYLIGLKFFFSHLKQVDLICIGSYACKAGKEIVKKSNFSTIFICSQQSQFQPSLMPIQQNPFINITPGSFSSKYDLESNIKSLDPERNVVEMIDGTRFKFRELIYSGSDYDWKDNSTMEQLAQGMKTPYTSIYGQHFCKNAGEMKQRFTGLTKFLVPKARHFGYENYFMLKLLKEIKKNALKSKVESNFDIQVYLEGQKFFPYSEAHDMLLKRKLLENGIVYYTNCNISGLNYKRRQIKINGAKQRYSCLYQYLPIKAPKILQDANIDPFEVEKLTLRHLKYPNINILGNNLPTTHSFYSLNYTTNVIIKNVLFSLQGIKKSAIYDGDTIIPLWTSPDSMMILASNYYGTKRFINNLGSNQIVGKMIAFQKKKLGEKQVSSFLKGFSKGFPYFLKFKDLKTITTDDSLVPMIIKQ